jgi:hypothetical protein
MDAARVGDGLVGGLSPVAGFEDLVAADLDHFSNEDEDAVGLDAGLGAEVGDGIVADDEVFDEGDADGSVRRGRPGTDCSDGAERARSRGVAGRRSGVLGSSGLGCACCAEGIDGGGVAQQHVGDGVRGDGEVFDGDDFEDCAQIKEADSADAAQAHAEDAVVIDKDIDERAARDD